MTFNTDLPSETGDKYHDKDCSGDVPLRVLLYSHDSWGLGHLRRSLAIAGALTGRFEQAHVLVVTGSPCATQFEIPERCDVLKLPAVSKDAEGRYVSRSLHSNIAQTIDLRARLIHESYRSFDPHVLIIDHQLTGLHGEALETLRQARDENKVLIYGMRDVLDEPDVVARAWDTHENHWALKQAYDRICIYGSADVFDPRAQYRVLAPYHSKIDFTGYIVSPHAISIRQAVPSFRKKVLVTMGGGEDGVERVQTYLQALRVQPGNWDSHIVTGPLMGAENVRHFKREVQRQGMAEQVRIQRFAPKLQRLLQESDAVVSMAGYNSCTEIMQSGIPAVLMPRTRPRKEQLIRARRLEALGLAQCMTSDDPRMLRQAVENALQSEHCAGRLPPLDGLGQFCSIIGELVDARWSRGLAFKAQPQKTAAE